MYDFFSCENSSSLVTHQSQHFSSNHPLTNTSTSIFFNCETMTKSLFIYHCALREDGTIVVSTYGEFARSF